MKVKINIEFDKIVNKNSKTSIHYKNIKSSLWSMNIITLITKKIDTQLFNISSDLNNDAGCLLDIVQDEFNSADKKQQKNLLLGILLVTPRMNINEVFYVGDFLYDRKRTTLYELHRAFEVNQKILVRCFEFILSLENSYQYSLIAIVKLNKIKLGDKTTFNLNKKGTDLERYLDNSSHIIQNEIIIKSMNLNIKRDLFKYLDIPLENKTSIMFFENTESTTSLSTEEMFNIGLDMFNKIVVLRNKVFHSEFILMRGDIAIIKQISRFQSSNKEFFMLGYKKINSSDSLFSLIKNDIYNMKDFNKKEIIIQKIEKNI